MTLELNNLTYSATPIRIPELTIHEHLGTAMLVIPPPFVSWNKNWSGSKVASDICCILIDRFLIQASIAGPISNNEYNTGKYLLSVSFESHLREYTTRCAYWRIAKCNKQKNGDWHVIFVTEY